MVDAQAAYDFGRLDGAVSAVNLGGKNSRHLPVLGFPVVMPIQPRSAYVTLKAKF